MIRRRPQAWLRAARPAAPPAAPVWEEWEDVAKHNGRVKRKRSRGTRSVVQVQTGYLPETLDELWAGAAPYFMHVHNGGGKFSGRVRSIWRAQHYFYIFLCYIHRYSPGDNFIDEIQTAKLHGVDNITVAQFYKDVMPLARLWSRNIDHIRWEDRLRWDNHHPFFPYSHTVIWDTTCFRVQRAADWQYASFVVNGHYDFPCFLVLTGITLTGDLVFGSDLFRVNAYDANIFEDTRHLHPQLPHELNIGDGHFATCPAFSTPAQKTGGRQLTLREQIWNQWVQLVRSRVEHLNTVIKQHQMFKGEPYRGWMKNLACFVKVTLHATAVEIRKREERDGPRYAGYGWWPHQ